MAINHEMLGYIFIKPIYIMEIGSWENLISSNGLFLGDLMEFNLEIWRRHAMRWYNHRKKIARTNHRRWGYTDWMKWTDNHEDYECVWMTMNDYDWFWMIMHDSELLWMFLNDYEWVRMIMNDCEWLWMIMNEYESSWMIVNDSLKWVCPNMECFGNFYGNFMISNGMDECSPLGCWSFEGPIMLR